MPDQFNPLLAHRQFAGVVLVSDNESWVGTGRHGSTGVMTQWQKFVTNQRKLGVANPKLVCIDLRRTPARRPRSGRTS